MWIPGGSMILSCRWCVLSADGCACDAGVLQKQDVLVGFYQIPGEKAMDLLAVPLVSGVQWALRVISGPCG